jgi:hypothetical protein
MGLHSLPARAEEEQPNAAQLKQQREARLRAMHKQVDTVAVKSGSGNEGQPASLHPEPLFRYADVPRGIIEASLWCWGAKGRPVALTKLEMVAPRDNVVGHWQYCIASLAEQPLVVTWPTRPQFLATKAGVDFRPIPDAPLPDDKPAGRLRQMKDLVKRFSATIFVDGKQDLKQEMRQLASPIHRYSDVDSGLTDGSIFGFSTNGTNPDVLLLIEAVAAGQQPSQWKFAVVGLTYAEFHVRISETEVYQMPFPPRMDTWTIRILPRTD